MTDSRDDRAAAQSDDRLREQAEQAPVPRWTPLANPARTRR